MSKLINKEIIEFLKQLLLKSEIRILIIEDSPVSKDNLEMVFEEAFPNSTTYCFEGFGVDQHDIEFLIKSKYDIVSVDGSLGKWEDHPVFGTNGANLVEFIKKETPETLVISISLEDWRNALALKKGANLAVNKSKLHEFLGEMKELRD